MKNFKLSMLTVALAAAGASSLAVAQDTQSAEAKDQVQKQVEVIEVRGIRRSLQQSQALKMESTSIVEAVSAEEIGKLPDMSIAESLARLPGLAAQRLDGRANVVSVRGLAPDFTTATLNGREQVTVGDNRGVEFDQYPSEMMSNVVVYKTPDASVMAQAIGGTIDMQTIRPLAHGEQTIVVNLRGERNSLGSLNPDGKENGYRGSVSYIDQFLDDTVGVAFGYAKMMSPNQEERWNAWGYTGAGDDNISIGGAKPFVRSSELDRDGWLGIVEYKPNEQLTTIVDVYYSKFNDTQLLRGIELPFIWGPQGNTLQPGYTSADGLVTKGVYTGVEGVMRNDVNMRDADTIAIGWNTEANLNDLWSVETDVSYSKAERTDFGLESYSGSGRGVNNGLKDTIGFEYLGNGAMYFDPSLDYSDANIMKLGGPLSWGNGLTVAGNAQDGFINTPHIEDEMSAVRLTAKRVFEQGTISSVEFGINGSQRDKLKRDTGLYLTLKDYPAELAVPAKYRLPDVSLGFIGMGNMLAYDSLALYRDGFYNETNDALNDTGRVQNNWDITEKVLTPYVKANLESEVKGIPVKGNFGLQAVHTDQSSDGFATSKDSTGYVIATQVSGGDKYWEMLPSFNFGFEVAEEQVVRIAAARTLARARMDRMNASNGYSYDVTKAQNTDINASPWSASGSNPALRPWMARQYDLSYETYFGDDGYFAAAVFYKDLENYVFNEQQLYDFTGLPVTGAEPSLRQGYINTPKNGNGGHVQGLELTLSVTGQMLHQSLTGFGAILSGSYTDSEVKENATSAPTALPGLSEKVVNATLYYENSGFEVRTSARYRSDFLGEVTGISLTRQTVSVQAETVIDAQIGYDFSDSGIEGLEGLSVLFQVSNLNNEPFVTYQNGDERQVRDFQNYGRNFMLGVSYKL
jgi:iron complex outermembrane receptor protein